MNLSQKWDSLVHRFLLWSAEKQVELAISNALNQYQGSTLSRVLLDNTIMRLGVTHTNVLQEHEVKFGPVSSKVMIPNRTTVKFKSHNLWLAQEQQFLPGLAKLGELGVVDFYTSYELKREQWLHSQSKYLGNVKGSSLFATQWVKEANTPRQRQFSRIMTSADWSTSEQRNFFNTIEDAEFMRMIHFSGPKHISDMFHLWTAHCANLDIFLTTDKTFINILKTAKKQKKLDFLNCRILLPSELAHELKVRPIDTEIFTPTADRF